MVNDAFRKQRVALGRTQEEIATATGLSRKTISDFERGVGAITLSNLNRILLAVGLELATRESSHAPNIEEIEQLYREDAEEPPRATRARRR